MSNTCQPYLNDTEQRLLFKIARMILSGLLNGGGSVTCGALSGAGAPTIAPQFIGQLYHDTVSDSYYRSTGLTSADWVAIAGGATPGIVSIASSNFRELYLTVGNTDTEFHFPNLTNIQNGCSFDSTTGVTVLGMPLIVNVGGNFDVNGFAVLTDLELSSLATVGMDFDCNTCSSLPILNLSLLTFTGGSFFCYDCSALTAINLSLLATIGGDCDFSNCVSLTTLNIPSLTSITSYFQCTGCTGLTTLGLPQLASVGGNFTCNSCTALATVDVSSWVPTDGTGIDFNGDALTATSVELILRRCVLAGVTTCTIDVSGGTNAGLASLSAQGQADAATLGAQLTIKP